eukprot:scaffold96764_cov39-Phaeocystis_antarctica.AAC.1
MVWKWDGIERGRLVSESAECIPASRWRRALDGPLPSTVCCGQRMTLQNKVVALREFFGLTSAPLLAAIAEMNVIMELPSEGSLLGQVDKLVSKTG